MIFKTKYKIVILLLICFTYSRLMSQQEQNKNMFFFSIGNEDHYLVLGSYFSNTIHFKSLETQSAMKLGITYHRLITDQSIIVSGFNSISRYSDYFIDTNFESKIYESFIEIPIGYSLFLGEFLSSRILFGLGININILNSQRFIVPEGTYISDAFRKENNFGDYIKIGGFAQTGFFIPIIKDRVSSTIVYCASNDHGIILIDEDVISTPKYGSHGFIISIGFNF